MIQIYSPGNTNYKQNGNMTLLPEEAKVNVVLGGTWSATLVHPLDSDGRWRYIEKEAVIKMPSFNGDQLFRIRQVQKTDYEVSCTMDPIFYDSRNECFIQKLEIEGKTAEQAAELLSSGKYSVESNITSSGSATYEGKNLLEALAGEDENSFVNVWGGEPIFDNYKVILNAEAGANNGVEIRYGKNIPQYGMQVEEDMTSVVTRIYPVAYNNVRMSDNGYVDSTIKDNYAVTYMAEVVYENVKAWEDWNEDDENDPNIICCKNQTELDAALRQKAQESFKSGMDKPTVTITTDLIMLQNTEQYQDVAGLESVSIGDTVLCRNSNIGVTVSARVIELEYNAVMKRVESVTLGDYSGSVFDAITSRLEEIDNLENRIKKVMRADGTIIAEKVKGFINGAVTQLAAMYDAAEKTDHIAVLFENLDATNPLYGALAIGTQGLMISKQRNATNDGWIWTTAMTANGLIANIIVAGLLSDSAGNNYWNLDTGEFRLSPANVSVADGESLEDLVEDLKTQITDAKIETWYQPSDPALEWTDEQKSLHVADIWYDSANNKTYRYGSSYTWQEIDGVSDNLLDKVDGKSTIYYGTIYKGTVAPTTSNVKYHYNGTERTTALTTGDFYLRTANNAVYKYSGSVWEAFAAEHDDYLIDSYDGSTYQWNNSIWTKVTDYKSKIDSLDNSLDQQEVFNRLTDNGTNAGIYLATVDGKKYLYINASMIKSGTVEAERIAAGSFTITGGSISINTDTFKVDEKGNLTAKSADITGKVVATSFRANGSDESSYVTVGDEINLYHNDKGMSGQRFMRIREVYDVMDGKNYYNVIELWGDRLRFSSTSSSYAEFAYRGSKEMYLDGGLTVGKELQIETADGDKYEVLHEGNVGVYESKSLESETKIATGTAKTLLKLSLSAGVWIVYGRVSFPNNTAGTRRIVLNSTENSSAQDLNIPASGSSQRTTLSYSKTIKLTSKTTICLTAWQSSGETLTISVDGAEIRAVKMR